MPSVLARFDTRGRAGLVVGPLLFIIVGLLLDGHGLSFEARWVGALVALMATWWITEPMPLWATACLPLLVFPLLGVARPYEVALQYFDPVNFLFLGGMMIAASMQQWGLHRRIALNIIAAIGVSPRRIVLGFMIATAFVSLWISNTATTVMMFPIAMAVLLKLGEQMDKEDPLLRRFGLALMLGIAYAASIGGIGTKIGTAPNIIMVKQAATVFGREIDFATWLTIGLPIVVVALPLVFLFLVHVSAPIPATGFPGASAVVTRERSELGRMSAGERISFVGFLTAALLWIFRNDIEFGSFTIPGWWSLVHFGWKDILSVPIESLPPALAKLMQQDLGDAAVAMGVAIALLLIPITLRPLRMALDIRRAAGVPWGLLVLLGGGLAMAYGMQRSGLSTWLGSQLQGIGHVTPFTAIVMVSFASLALTEVASNVATASILVPLVAAGAGGFGLHPAPLMFAATLTASFGFMLPAGTPPNAIVYSSGYITVPQMVRAGIAVDIFGALLVATMCYFIVPWALNLN
jgi:solute carrier family 13 (sodium-dependent dicarboxylate transporter), member 2/3/5